MWQATSGEAPWQSIVSSPLRRCSEFAQALGERLAIPLSLDERLREVGFGAWEGKTSEQLRASDPERFSRFYHDPIHYRPAGAEPLEQFMQRVEGALDEAIAANRGRHLLIIAHAGVIRAILTRSLRAPLTSMYRLSITTASLSRLRLDGERPPTVLFHGRQRL